MTCGGVHENKIIFYIEFCAKILEYMEDGGALKGFPFSVFHLSYEDIYIQMDL
jgi:hypothetical protein